MNTEERKQFLNHAMTNLTSSIKTQLRAKPLGVEVADAWIDDLVRNAASGIILAYYDATGLDTCPICGTDFDPAPNTDVTVGCDCNGETEITDGAWAAHLAKEKP